MRFSIFTCLVLLIVLSGCSSTPTPVDVPQPVVVVAPPKPANKEVVILVSDDINAYSSVASALIKQLGRRASIHYMSGSRLEIARMLVAYKDDERKQFVSIGLSATLASKVLTNRQVMFCQVFNYQDYDLVSDRHKGVSMVPSITRTFATWRKLAPNITDIGVISGPGFESMMQLARTAAKNQGITLHHETVSSDKEYQFAYKQMSEKVQGYWLIPDNRVLSGNILRDVMNFSVRNSKQVAVFSDELLNLGGLFSYVDDPQGIAQEIVRRLDLAKSTEDIPGPDIVYLDRSILRINNVMARRLNLEIPEQFQQHENAQ